MRSSSASPGPKCAPRAARCGSRPNRSRSWACSRSSPICRACCACARRIRREMRSARPDVFVGIDAPEFNLGLARSLHAAGIPTVQYVSPQVWAWRQSRVRSIHPRSIWCSACCRSKSASTTTRAWAPNSSVIRWPMRSRCEADRGAARAALGIAARRRSRRAAARQPARRGSRLCRDFAATARWLADQRRQRANSSRRWRARRPARSSRGRSPRSRRTCAVQLIDGQAQTALIAADAALVASGTASLEAALCKRPMVVVYRLGALTAWILRRLNLVKSKFLRATESTCGSARRRRVFSGTNRPGGDRSGALGVAGRCSDGGRLWSRSSWAFTSNLKRDASARAAQAILALCWARRRSRHEAAAIAGVDEAGRGPLAGPVVAAAVILRAVRPSPASPTRRS